MSLNSLSRSLCTFDFKITLCMKLFDIYNDTTICQECAEKYVQNLLKSMTLLGSSHCGSAETNLTSIHEDAGLIPGLAQWVKVMVLPWNVAWVTDTPQIPRCYGCCIGQQLQRLAWEASYAMCAPLKKNTTTTKKHDIVIIWDLDVLWYYHLISKEAVFQSDTDLV